MSLMTSALLSLPSDANLQGPSLCATACIPITHILQANARHDCFPYRPDGDVQCAGPHMVGQGYWVDAASHSSRPFCS